MKICILIIVLIIQVSICHPEPGTVRTDADICATLLSNAAENILKKHHDLLPGKTVQLDYSGSIRLSSFTRSMFEAYLTRCGCRLTSGNGADYAVMLTVTDSSIILIKKNNLFERSITLAVHFICYDSDNTVILASGSVETNKDSISKKLIRKTDNVQQFSRDSRRIIVKKSYKRLMTITMLIIAGALSYFSSQ